MVKLNKEFKVKLYKLRKEGKSIGKLSKEYESVINNLKYVIRLIERYKIEISERK